MSLAARIWRKVTEPQRNHRAAMEDLAAARADMHYVARTLALFALALERPGELVTVDDLPEDLR